MLLTQPEPSRQTSLALDSELHKRLKIYAAVNDVKLNVIIPALIRMLVDGEITLNQLGVE